MTQKPLIGDVNGGRVHTGAKNYGAATPRKKFGVVFREYENADHTGTLYVWGATEAEARAAGRIKAYEFGLWPEVVDIQEIGPTRH